MNRIHLFDDAIAEVRAFGHTLGTERTPLHQAIGRVSATDVVARVSVPPFRRAMMDGFAVRSTDLAIGGELRVIGTRAAGDQPQEDIGPGQALRIMTGAAVPPSADAVVRFEWCDDQVGDQIRILRTVKPGESVQPIGDDGMAGNVILRKGEVLRTTELAVLRTFGISHMDVFQRPRVAIVITGSELQQDVNRTLTPGQIYGCNDLLISGCVESSGGTVASIDYVADDLALLESVLDQRSTEVDCIITTGGVSVGDYDFVPRALTGLSAEVCIEKVWMRPGSPFRVARLNANCVLFGLSGNPAACLIQFEALVRSYFDACIGQTCFPFPYTGVLRSDLALKPIKHIRILRAFAEIADGVVQVDCSMAQSAGVLSSFGRTNCLIRVDDAEEAKSGTIVPLKWFRPLA